MAPGDDDVCVYACVWRPGTTSFPSPAFFFLLGRSHKVAALRSLGRPRASGWFNFCPTFPWRPELTEPR